MEKLNEAIENLEQVVETKDDNIEAVATLNPVMADAYIQSKKVDRHLQEVADELNKRAQEVMMDSPTDNAEKMPENMYTDKLTLQEDLEDFSMIPNKDGRSHRQAARDENDGNKFLDYDMFIFVHELFAGQNCNTNPAPKTPIIYGKILNRKTKEVTYGMRPMRKFLDSGVENRQVNVDERNFGVPQVAADGDNIIISAAEKEDLNDVIEACKIFQFKHSPIEASRGVASHWPWRITVYVPVISPGYPMLLEDYLDDIGMTIEDVMFDEFAKGYRNAQAKLEKETQKEYDSIKNNSEVDKLFDAAVQKAARDATLPLRQVANELIKQLKDAGLTYKRKDILDRFYAEFDDNYENEE